VSTLIHSGDRDDSGQDRWDLLRILTGAIVAMLSAKPLDELPA
jgi:hypothetical protein